MPFTPFHFGPAAMVSLPFNKYINIPVFILANVMIDLEPLFVMIFNYNYPLHGYLHTYLFGSIAGILLGLSAHLAYRIIKPVMTFIALNYKKNLIHALISGILGVWLHIFFDSFIYSEIAPFFPVKANPFAGLISSSVVYSICLFSFIPAILIYLLTVVRYRKHSDSHESNDGI